MSHADDLVPASWQPAIARFAAGEMSPWIALTHILLSGEEGDPAARLAALAAADPGNAPLAALSRVAQQHRERLVEASAVVASGIDPSTDDVTATRAHFDRLVARSPEASVALYSLGDPGLLDAATAELADAIGRWVELDGRVVLDFGCGIGRVAAALAPRAHHIVGIDLSANMLAEARRRTAGLPNLAFQLSNGDDLGELQTAAFDLVLAVDSFPYLVRAGGGLLARLLSEMARVLRPDGDLLVYNWSYGGDVGQDMADAKQLGEAAGFRVIRAGEKPFSIWDAAGFHLRRAA